MSRLFLTTLIGIFFAISVGGVGADVLVSYSFDDDNIESGPDTFQIFKKAQGTVELSMNYRYSGYYSVQIGDVAGDGDFPELQGYFPLVDRGTLHLHFKIMMTDPNETLNIALAGPKWFRVKKDGIGFWLTTKNGYLYQVSGRAEKKLFPVNAFFWYSVDVIYRVNHGDYDLVIYEEGGKEPIVFLTAQTNAPNQPASAVDKFSFIGDKGEDNSNVVYYVDDVVVSTQEDVTPAPFIAPGRRKLFIDLYNEYHFIHGMAPQCLPVVELSDIGVTPREIAELKQDGLFDHFIEIISLKNRLEGNSSTSNRYDHPALAAAIQWYKGCSYLKQKQPDKALELFEQATKIKPTGKIYGLSSTLALAMVGRWQETDYRLAVIYLDWKDDVRFAAAQALIGIERNDVDSAENLLGYPAELIVQYASNSGVKELWGNRIDRSLIERLQRSFGNKWRRIVEDRFVAEQYFYILLWKGWYSQALQYAEAMATRLKQIDLPTALWLEHGGDAAFLLKDYQSALAWYEESLKFNDKKTSTLLKLSDVHFSLGDLEAERRYREMIYSSLRTKH